MTRHEASVVVDRPIDEVWAFLADPFNWPRFVGGGMLAVRQTSPGPAGLGSTFEGRMVILGLERRTRGAMTVWDPPHSATFSIVGMMGIRSGSFRTALQATAAGTKVVRSFELEPGPILKPVWPIVGPLVMREYDAGIHDLKRLLEAGSRRSIDAP